MELDHSHGETWIELLALESLVQHNLEIRTVKENGKKANREADPQGEDISVGREGEEQILKEKWKTDYHGPCSREEELQALDMSELSEKELSPGEE